ncbi:MAG: class I SAM-dependent methyltransferase [Magnetococcus sp. YQC-3]
MPVCELATLNDYKTFEFDLGLMAPSADMSDGYLQNWRTSVLINMSHDSWADYYDFISKESFGSLLDDHTKRVIERVFECISPPACVLDLGAGTGRLAVPLAASGYRVTAVEQSSGMLTVLEKKVHDQELPIKMINASVTNFVTGHPHDLAVSLFTTLNYFVTQEDIRMFANCLRKSLQSRGIFIFDLAMEGVFSSVQYRSESVVRDIKIYAHDDARYTYRETTCGMLDGLSFQYEDKIELRYWELDDVLRVFQDLDFVLLDELTDFFQGAFLHRTFMMCRT